MRQRCFTVEIFGERFQIDIGCVHMVVDIMEGLARDVAVADHHRSQASFPGGTTDVHDVFAPDGRLVVGKGDRGTAVMQRELRHILGRNMSRMNLVAPGLGDVPILAKEAAHIATSRAKRKNLRAGQEMIQRLLFDGINLQSRGRGVAQAIELASLVYANKTEAALPLANVAVPRAQIAVHASVWLRLPPASLVQLGMVL